MSKKLHILGIGGTFMGSLALLARGLGYEVLGSDVQTYPPMSTQLAEQQITVYEGYDAANIDAENETLIIGNAMKRGNPMVEQILNRRHRFFSGPQWLAQEVLSRHRVLAVSGTHGKTTTASMLAWILEVAGQSPGFLIGGIPNNFGCSARLGSGEFFVIEADEYDSAFFDKRAKFIHYLPELLIINNLEHDHADIYPDLAAIQQQFHHLVRTLPAQGKIIVPAGHANIETVLNQGCWTPILRLGESAGWQLEISHPAAQYFSIVDPQQSRVVVEWSLTGIHNAQNALHAVVAAHEVGISPSVAAKALCQFKSVKRRMEWVGTVGDVEVYDDFAHHPTAIQTTLEGLRARVGGERRIIVLVDFGSYTMRSGQHALTTISTSLQNADAVFTLALPPQYNTLPAHHRSVTTCKDGADLVKQVCQNAKPKDVILILSNTGFSKIREQLMLSLASSEGEKI